MAETSTWGVGSMDTRVTVTVGETCIRVTAAEARHIASAIEAEAGFVEDNGPSRKSINPEPGATITTGATVGHGGSGKSSKTLQSDPRKIFLRKIDFWALDQRVGDSDLEYRRRRSSDIQSAPVMGLGLSRETDKASSPCDFTTTPEQRAAGVRALKSGDGPPGPAWYDWMADRVYALMRALEPKPTDKQGSGGMFGSGPSTTAASTVVAYVRANQGFSANTRKRDRRVDDIPHAHKRSTDK